MSNPTWLYKAKRKESKVHKDWQPCTNEEKERLEKMVPYRFEFKKNESPKPTPSMKKAATKEEKKPKE